LWRGREGGSDQFHERNWGANYAREGKNGKDRLKHDQAKLLHEKGGKGLR